MNIIINLEGQTIEEIPSKIRSQNLKQSKYFIMMKQLKKIVFLLILLIVLYYVEIPRVFQSKIRKNTAARP